MFSFIWDLLSSVLKNKLKPYVTKQLNKLLDKKTLNELWLKLTIIVLVVLTMYSLWIRISNAIQFAPLTPNASNQEQKFITLFLRSVSEFSIYISIVSVVVILILSIIGILKKMITPKFGIIALLISLAFTVGNSSFGKIEDQLSTMAKAKKYGEAINLWENGKFQDSIDILYAIYFDDPFADVADDALARIGGAYYKSEDYKSSIFTSAGSLYKYPSSNIRDEIVTTLHWGIYQLGNEMELDAAIEYIEFVKQNYPVPEVSPIWIGIPLKFMRQFGI